MINAHDQPIMFFIAKYSVVLVLLVGIVTAVVLPLRIILSNRKTTKRTDAIGKISPISKLDSGLSNRERSQRLIYWSMVMCFIVLCMLFAVNMLIYCFQIISS
jgi:hypothetical protein